MCVLRGDLNGAVHAAHMRQERDNMEQKARAEIINRQRADAIAEREAKQRSELEQRVKKENPAIYKFHEQKIAEAKQYESEVTELARQFYNLESDKARKYIAFKHDITKSAVQDIAIQVLDDYDKFKYFECSTCADRSYNLDKFERHAYLDRNGHEKATIRAIGVECRKQIHKANEELQKDIHVSIVSIKNREIKEREDAERRANERLGNSLPYVK